MLYKALGIAAWKVVRLYLRRRMNARKVAVGAGVAAAAAGGAAAARHSAANQ